MTEVFLISGVDLFSHGPTLAYVGIVVFLMLTGAGLPVPEEVFIIAAGAASAQGELDPRLAFAACLFGALAGDCILYWIGYHFGRRVVREHHWWTRFVHPEREAQMERMIRDHGLKVLFLTRFLVGIRAPVYLSAGVLHVRFRRFFLIDLFCATMVIGTFFGLSYFLSDRYGESIYAWIHGAEVGFSVAVAAVVVAAAIFFYWRHRRRKAAQLPLAQLPLESSRPACQDPELPQSPNDPTEKVVESGNPAPVDVKSTSRRT